MIQSASVLIATGHVPDWPEVRANFGLAGAVLLLLTAACAPDPDREPTVLSLPDAVAVVSDTDAQRVQYIRLADQELLLSLDLRALAPEDCDPAIGEGVPEDAACLPFQTNPETVTDADGDHDELTLAYDRVAGDPWFERTAIERVRLSLSAATERPTTRWRLDALDFATNFPGESGICANTNPCEPGADDNSAALEQALLCRLAQVHDFDVLAEDDTSVELLIADSENDRVLTVHLDRSTTCGVVTDVMNDTTVGGWAGRVPNDVDTVPLDDGGAGVLVTFRSTSGDVATGGLAGGGNGSGVVMLFTPGSPGWEHAWTFPASGFLNSPHDSSIVNSESGAHYLVGAHSDGRGAGFQDDWKLTTDGFGSITIAALGGDVTGQPDYQRDLVVSATGTDAGLGFVRAVHPFLVGVPGTADPAGTDWILADSGCMAGEEACQHTPGIRAVKFDLDDPSNSDGSGAFNADRSEQTDQAMVASAPIGCGLSVPYIVDLLWFTGEAVPESGEGCPE